LRLGIARFASCRRSESRRRYPALTLTVIRAEERGTPKNRKKIDWKLITYLPVGSRTDAIEKLEWYDLRWKIEVFHKILKSSCKAEESKLRTAQRLTNLISLFCILSWRVFWMTMLNRSAPDAPPTLAFGWEERGTMKASKVSDGQKAFILKQGNDGVAVAKICRKAGISQATYYNWKKKYDGLLPTEIRRLKQLEAENGKLKKLVADLSLDKEMLQDVIRRNVWSAPPVQGSWAIRLRQSA